MATGLEKVSFVQGSELPTLSKISGQVLLPQIDYTFSFVNFFSCLEQRCDIWNCSNLTEGLSIKIRMVEQKSRRNLVP